MYIDKPDDLIKYIKRVIKSDLSEEKKDKWAGVMQEILEDWKNFQPSKWEKVGKTILKFMGGIIIGQELTGLVTSGIEKLYEWVKSKMEE